MNLREVEERLNVSRQTLYRWRKKLGIVAETRLEINDSQYKQFEKLSRQRYKRGQKKEGQREVENNDVTHDVTPLEKRNMLQIIPEEAIELKNLKKQYNSNIEKLEFMEIEASQQMKLGYVPEKYLMDMIEKYQKACIQIISAIQKINPEQDELANAIKERLANYG